MKSIKYLVILFFIASIQQSCEPVVQSLYPLYTSELLIEEPLVEGIWYYNNSSKDTIFWEVKTCKEKKYLIKVFENTNKTEEVFFYMHLIKLNDQIYADLFPLEESFLISDSDPGVFLMSHLTPVHSFSKLSIRNNNIKAHYFASKWLISTLQNHKKCIDYHKIKVGDCEGEDCYLLTSPPHKLQKLILKYGEDNFKLQDNKINFKRLKSPNKN